MFPPHFGQRAETVTRTTWFGLEGRLNLHDQESDCMNHRGRTPATSAGSVAAFFAERSGSPVLRQAW
jgi:hypothetical protein